MKILILTQYFPPETGAPQNRLYNLCKQLQPKAEKITVLTALPNYPKYEIFEGYRGRWIVKEEMEGIEILRSYIFARKSTSSFLRLVNYFSFVCSSFFVALFNVKKIDLIICESPPLFLGITAIALKKIKKARLLFNVSDLWPETAVKLKIVTNPLLIRFSTWLEEWIYRHSDLISGQTQGICENIRSRFPQKRIFWLKNGVDYLEVQQRLTNYNWRATNGYESDDFLVYFGGLIGYAQGLDCILKAAARLQHFPKIQFILIGEGPDKPRLLALQEALQLTNVHFYDGVSKKEIADVIVAMDVAVIPLKKIDLFLGAIPSKIFEISSLQKPLLLGIEGEAKILFIEEARAGLAFEPENDADLANNIIKLYENPAMIKEFGENGGKYVRAQFNQTQISHDFWDFINDTNQKIGYNIAKANERAPL